MSEAALKTVHAHIAAGRLDQARAHLSQLVTRNSSSAEAVSLLAWTLMQLGRHDQARFYAQRACELSPGSPDPLFNLGKLHMATGEYARAVECFEKAHAAAPDDPAILAPLTKALNHTLRYADAERTARQAADRWPTDPEFPLDLALALRSSGRAREAVPILRQAALAHPDNLSIAMLHANTVNYPANVDPRDAFEAHAAFGRILERTLPGDHRPPRNDPDPDRALRVGIISADLRDHAVGFFIRPLFEHHDRKALSISCFSTSTKEDAATKHLKSHAAAWHAVPTLTIGRLAELIRREKIDILIELSGHTAGHRLEVFQLRPAPISVSYLGYPATSGLRTIDYRIVDSLTDPDEPWYDDLATEKLWRLDPCFICCPPRPDDPPVSPPPSASGAPFTFGSFNNLAKHDEASLALYKRVLDAVPGSRFRLKYWGAGNPGVRDIIIRRFASAGIDESRLYLDPPGAPDAASLLPEYASMDVMLDTFPYNGTTTICEALWMGVPVVTLEGRVSAARVGKCLLTTIGLPELVAQNESQYAAIAAGLASDPARLASLRSSLRARMLASPLCDGPAYAHRFEAALRAMWRQWCLRQA